MHRAVEADLEDPSFFDAQTAQKMLEMLAGREDMYTREGLDADGKRVSEYVPEPLTIDVLRSHLQGTDTVGTYLIRSNDTVHYMVIDVDISRKAIITCSGQKEQFQEYLQHAADTALNVQNILQKMGLKTCLEFSGYRGYHIWLFLEQCMPIRYAYSLFEIVQSKVLPAPADITIEFFPAKNLELFRFCALVWAWWTV